MWFLKSLGITKKKKKKERHSIPEQKLDKRTQVWGLDRVSTTGGVFNLTNDIQKTEPKPPNSPAASMWNDHREVLVWFMSCVGNAGCPISRWVLSMKRVLSCVLRSSVLHRINRAIWSLTASGFVHLTILKLQPVQELQHKYKVHVLILARHDPHWNKNSRK